MAEELSEIIVYVTPEEKAGFSAAIQKVGFTSLLDFIGAVAKGDLVVTKGKLTGEFGGITLTFDHAGEVYHHQTNQDMYTLLRDGEYWYVGTEDDDCYNPVTTLGDAVQEIGEREDWEWPDDKDDYHE